MRRDTQDTRVERDGPAERTGRERERERDRGARKGRRESWNAHSLALAEQDYHEKKRKRERERERERERAYKRNVKRDRERERGAKASGDTMFIHQRLEILSARGPTRRKKKQFGCICPSSCPHTSKCKYENGTNDNDNNKKETEEQKQRQHTKQACEQENSERGTNRTRKVFCS